MASKNTPAPDESLGSLFKLADVALSAAESFAALNVATARQAFADGARNTKAILSVKSAEDAAQVQSALVKPSSLVFKASNRAGLYMGPSSLVFRAGYRVELESPSLLFITVEQAKEKD